MMKFFFFLLFLNFLMMFYKNMICTMMTINLIFILNFKFLINNFYLNYYWNNINYILGLDNFSLILIILTFWILNLSMFASKIPLNNKFKNYFINIMILLINILMISFSSINLMMFYIFFETSLIPIMLILMGWGMQIDKIQASMYMIFYTLFGSLPLLMMYLYMYMKFNTLMINILIMKSFFLTNNLFFYMTLNSAFLMKLPMFMIHLWLPKAHVEAPISGSMILAGIMLKLGSYGIYRTMLIFPKMFFKFNFFLMMILMIGSILSSLMTLNQSDMKIIVAYSSIVHMNFMLMSMLTMYYMSLKGGIMMMFAHGLCSSGMFFLVNINYENIHSRNIFLNKGLMMIYPSLTLWWFLTFSSNFAAPPSLNLFSEIFLINCLLQWEKIFMIPISLISFFSTCYSIFLYSFSQYGKYNFSLMNFNLVNCKEYLICILHWLPLNMFFLNLIFF